MLSPKEEIRTEAIVLRSYPSGDSDLVLHLLSKEHGRISVIAKGARRSRKRYSNCPDIFDYGFFSYKSGRGALPYLSEFTTRTSFRSFRMDLLKMAAASSVCECVDFLVKEESEGHEEIYTLISKGLSEMDMAPNQRTALKLCFEIIKELLELSGFLSEQEKMVPNLRNLKIMLAKVESVAERELKAKQALVDLAGRAFLPET